MTLPDGFRWTPASQHEKGPPTALTLHGEDVARMVDRIDGGGWFVILEQQRPVPRGQTFGPLILRNCSSFENGRRGTELWATRHEARIRVEVAARIASRTRHLACPRL